MRATYDDLLKAVGRRAVETPDRVSGNRGEVAAGWQAVLTASRRHLLWLRCELVTPDLDFDVVSDRGDPVLLALAQSLGAGADLLAGQDAVTAAAFDDRAAVGAARSSVAAASSVAALSALRAIQASRRRRSPLPDPLAEHLRMAHNELRVIASQTRRQNLGALGRLATGMPAHGTDRYAEIAHAAARWQRMHEEDPARSLLTRDLRATTAQIHTAIGHGRHFVRSIGAAGPRLGLDDKTMRRLRLASTALRQGAESTVRLATVWQRHRSDLGGRTSLASEFAFAELHELVREAVNEDGVLREPAELIPDRETASSALGAVDEMIHGATEVARLQQSAVFRLVAAGRLYIPRRIAARVEPMYSGVTGSPTAARTGIWMKDARIDCFRELTESLDLVTGHLGEASDVCRQLAGTDDERWPRRSDHKLKPRLPEKLAHHRRRTVAPSIDQAAAGPDVELP